jgi:hypothetical protein
VKRAHHDCDHMTARSKTTIIKTDDMTKKVKRCY